MRILILANADIGLYKFRKELLESLCKEYEVFIALPDGEYIPYLKQIGCCFIPFEFNRRGTNPFADIWQMLNYYSIIKKIKPDIVLTYTIKPNVYGGMACQIAKVPYIANITGLGTTIENGGILGRISTTLYQIGLKKALCVFFQNKSNRKLFVDKGIVKGKTRLIPGSGVNLEIHKYEQYPEDNGELRFLFVGRIMKDKGIEELLLAMKKIHNEDNKNVLDVVGFCDEDYADELKTAETEGSIVFHGTQSDVHPFYTRCNCTVLPSYHEGMANVLLESSSTGRPVIATNVPGCIETFDEGITGFGCEAKSSDSLLDAFRKFIALPYSEKIEMGANARKKMEREYDRKIVIDAYLEEINAVTF